MTTTEMQQILSRLNVLESELTVGQAAIMQRLKRVESRVEQIAQHLEIEGEIQNLADVNQTAAVPSTP